MVSSEKCDQGLDVVNWNSMVGSYPNAHIFQTWQWGQFKQRYGWNPILKYWKGDQLSLDGMSLILERNIQFIRFAPIFKILYIPKGPLINWLEEESAKFLLENIKQFAHEKHAVFIKLDPDVIIARGLPGNQDYSEIISGQNIRNMLIESGWIYSNEQVQFPNTVVVDLTPTIEEILARMKQKTRYNIRLAEKRGVQIRPGTLDDLGILYTLYAQTSIRDGFVIREKDYYLNLWKDFIQCGMAEPLIAQYDGEPIAAVISFMFANRCWFLYGMSSELHREKMPNYLLQWHVILQAKEKGCRIYDMWGAPDEFIETDRLWNVFRFKIGFGGFVEYSLGAWDLPINPFLYSLYNRLLPKVLALMRVRGKQRTQHSLGM